MGRCHVSAAGQRARELPTAAGTDTHATLGQQEHQRAGDHTSHDRACGGCHRRNGSPRLEACMAGCSGRMSRGTRAHRQPLWPVAQDRDNWIEPGRGRKRASAGGPADGAQCQQKRHKAAKDAEGGSQTKDLAPPLPATLFPERGLRSGLPASSPDFLSPFQEGAAADPAPNPPPPRPAGRRQREGRPQRHRGRHQNRGISANPQHTATAGKQPVQAGSPGLSTPSKPKRGRGAVGAGTASRAPAPGPHRPAAARGLFALGFTRSAAVMPPGDEGKRRGLCPREDRRPRARGTEGPTAKTPEPLARVLLSRRVH